MSLNEEIVQKLDEAKKTIQEVYGKLDPENYTKFYEKIWKARSEIEFIVISLKLLNDLESKKLEGKWKEEFSSTLKQIRAERKVKEEFVSTIEMFNQLENINDIIEFYKICWKLKEKITILLNVVKPKIKVQQNKNSKKTDLKKD